MSLLGNNNGKNQQGNLLRVTFFTILFDDFSMLGSSMKNHPIFSENWRKKFFQCRLCDATTASQCVCVTKNLTLGLQWRNSALKNCWISTKSHYFLNFIPYRQLISSLNWQGSPKGKDIKCKNGSNIISHSVTDFFSFQLLHFFCIIWCSIRGQKCTHTPIYLMSNEIPQNNTNCTFVDLTYVTLFQNSEVVLKKNFLSTTSE